MRKRLQPEVATTPAAACGLSINLEEALRKLAALEKL
jgi:hypothetical protein